MYVIGSHVKGKGGTRCRHMAVDDHTELDKKRSELRMLLEDENWLVGAKGGHIEERVKSESIICCDPEILNKDTDSQYIDSVSGLNQ